MNRQLASPVTGWQRWTPILATLRSYQPRWLARDLIAGLVLTTTLVPVGIAYAEASGLPGVLGLYATIVPLLIYAIFGPSRILVLGPDSSLAALIFAVVVPLSHGDPARAVALAGMMALVSGLVCVLIGVFRAGFITELLSKPIRYGFMNGIALTVLIGQLPRLLGVSIDRTGRFRDLWQIALSLIHGHAHLATIAVGLPALVVVLALKRYTRFNGLLLAVVGATIATALLHLESRGVEVIGPLPRGFPGPAFPRISLADMPAVAEGALAVALVSFADTSILSRTYAARTRAFVDPNQEMIALGLANLGAGLFRGFPISSSSSRTPVAETSGAQTQLTGVFAAAGVALLLVVWPNLLRDLPAAALAAVVIASAIGLFELADLRRIYRIQRWEFWLSVTCFIGVTVFGAIPGIAIAIGIAVIEFLWDGWRPRFAILGQVDGLRGYHDVQRHPDARQVPGLLLFRWDAPLFFANADLFETRVLRAVASAPSRVRRVVVTAEPVTSVDVTSADMLAALEQRLRAAQIELCFAEMKDPVTDKLKRFQLFDQLGAENFYPTINAAVDAYVARYDVDWKS